jgi:sensor histidine kinase YesM
MALALATASECRSVLYPPSLLYGAVLWGWWGCFASMIWKLGPRRPSMLRFSREAIALHLLAACALGVGHLLLLGGLGFTVAGWRAHSTALAIWTSLLNINRFGMEILIYGFVFGITGIVQYQVRAQRDAMKALELEKQLSAAHLRALQMQLEPHFLFNTLNAITTLVELGRQKEAAEMLAHLNAILKSTLTRTTPEKVPLSQELEIVENYLAIEQVRFADRLRIEIKIDPGALDSLVPCFLLQPIVENAIRHGIAHCENEGVVEASARRVGHELHLRVRDTGRSFSAHRQNGHGIGLSNTRERLMHFYQDAYDMKAHPMETGGFEVAITIPYERG